MQEPPPLEAPRPVVTFMARPLYRRAVLNRHEVMRYILERYNVTLRVTTFEARAGPGPGGRGWVRALYAGWQGQREGCAG